MTDLQPVVEQLESISEDLGDRSMTLLRETLETGDADALDAEKRISRARRSIDKAISLLAGADRGMDD